MRFDALCQNLSLIIVYHVKKWLWNDEGVYSFLNETDQTAMALSCYAAYNEHSERMGDDEYVLSPRQDDENVVVQNAP